MGVERRIVIQSDCPDCQGSIGIEYCPGPGGTQRILEVGDTPDVEKLRAGLASALVNQVSILDALEEWGYVEEGKALLGGAVRLLYLLDGENTEEGR